MPVSRAVSRGTVGYFLVRTPRSPVFIFRPGRRFGNHTICGRLEASGSGQQWLAAEVLDLASSGKTAPVARRLPAIGPDRTSWGLVLVTLHKLIFMTCALQLLVIESVLNPFTLDRHESPHPVVFTGCTGFTAEPSDAEPHRDACRRFATSAAGFDLPCSTAPRQGRHNSTPRCSNLQAAANQEHKGNSTIVVIMEVLSKAPITANVCLEMAWQH